MKLVSFVQAGNASWGVLDRDVLIDVGRAIPGIPDLKSYLNRGTRASLATALSVAEQIDPRTVEWLPAIPNPEKVLCVGLNYETHVKETGRSKADYPTIFTRFSDTQVGHEGSLIRPRVSTQFDYEGELAVIIGRGGRAIPHAEAMHHVAGYACYNDATVRDWQRHTQQFTPGKNFPGTGAFGPVLITADEIADVSALSIATRVNGATVQAATLDQLIFSIPRLIEYCSAFTPLAPGDVIATGTPGGVGFKRTPPLWLQPGDLVEVEISGIGILRNQVRDEGK
jgi:2-keto-4-pentenoate hydratase/2-oxohepta-3-ene-1,7-dioic acid hydratase in catechol pathway